MSKKQKTLNHIFELPTRSDVKYNEVEQLLLSLGAEKEEGAGSRVKFKVGDDILFLHKPHPQKEMKEYAVNAVRDFLILIGESP